MRITLEDLINWLKSQNQNLIVKDGFGFPHSDRGNYEELAFDPQEYSKISDMLKFAKSAVNKNFKGYKGGLYKMYKSTYVYIGHYGECGEPITSYNFKYWLLTGIEESC